MRLPFSHRLLWSRELPRFPALGSLVEMAGDKGIEPLPRLSESPALPLRQSPIKWLEHLESNQEQEFQRLLCCHYTMLQYSDISTVGTRGLIT
jgi:hypothetical protein